MAHQALQNQRRPEQHIEVTFDDHDPAEDEPTKVPHTPAEVAPPADLTVSAPPADLTVARPSADVAAAESADGVPGSSPSSSGDRVK